MPQTSSTQHGRAAGTRRRFGPAAGARRRFGPAAGARRRFGRLALVSLLAVGFTASAPVVQANAASTVYQAESATISQGLVESNHAGYTGTGFVNYDNLIGSWVEFSVSSSAAESVTLVLRHSNGTATNRPMSVTVNGTVISASTAFGSTGNWDNWANVSVAANLSAGTNTIRATATTSNGGPNLDSLTVNTSTPTFDWSRAVVDSTMARFTPSTVGGWNYTTGLYLWGQYLVYQRTHDPALLSYIRAWADRFVDSNGNINNSFNNLDAMQSGNILIALFTETGLTKYRTAATKIRTRLNTYPRTTDGGFWHSTGLQNQLWSDGVFMVNPFLGRYGKTFNDATYANNETTKQLVVYASHLKRPNGLMRHAYDQNKIQGWADPVTGVSREHWCRAIGWFAMATTEILEIIPANHPQRAALVTIIKDLVAAFKTYQDPVSGRWFQVADKGGQSGNWTETSCSSMFVYTTSRAIERGYVSGVTYQSVVTKGYAGVMDRVSLGSDGRTNITEICIGTGVGDYAFYIARPRQTNDFHGLGAFLIMNEQIMRVGA
jgi:unsaturated rhamnogalacturonyl hydrolase